MGAFSDEMDATVLELFTELGAPITLISTTRVKDTNNLKNITSSTISTDTVAVPDKKKTAFLRKQMMNTDVWVYWVRGRGLPSKPDEDDKVSINGAIYKILQSNPSRVQEDDLVYELVLGV